MDKETRNLLFNTTQAIRRLLEEEFSLQLEGTFDIHAEGRLAEQPGSQLLASERLVRCRIVEAIQHRLAVGESAAEAVRGFQSEAVFTFLNRLAALKMMEARALVLPCVSQGDQSQGFKEFSGLAPGLIELPDKGYRLYLECLFDEIGREVGVLFDRTDAASQLWPRRKALETVLAELNTPELGEVWGEDETIGWIYQYYNDPEERKQMREESSAPRNSRELAVRNQFFTPRYVVEFLTDNTLGRIWYEMTQGQTRLKDQCRYLVRRPTEVFLAEGQIPPPLNPATDNYSQEDLLKQPVHIPHRPLKDPREIRMIDPACGSMHFGLYAFDLFRVIYDEAWEIAHGTDAAEKSTKSFAPFVTFAASFVQKEAFLREVPRLIVEHNIHGIDIDPRAAQIAGLALWLRAQRAWQAMGIKAVDRPSIRRSNIVCAEPMPGEKDLFLDFVQRQFIPAERPLFQTLLENIWDKMRLAGETGSLLKIEEEIRSGIDEARQAFQRRTKRPAELFSIDEINRVSKVPELAGLDLAVSTLPAQSNPDGPTADFWQVTEERIYSALRDYAKQAEQSGGFQHRLFADDAAQGFAFIDLCRKRYDVVVMNPPFGLSSEKAEPYLQDTYPNGWVDLYACFIWRGIDFASFGRLGAITSRSFISSKKLERLRASQLIPRLEVLADLGKGVMDAANVEACAYTLSSTCVSDHIWAVDLASFSDREQRLKGLVEASTSADLHQPRREMLLQLPNARLLYSIPPRITEMLRASTRFEPTIGTVRCGLTTFDDVRFLRASWEVPPAEIGIQKRWECFEKGGEYGNYYGDIHLIIKRFNNGAELAAVNQQINGQTAQSRQASTYYYRPGAYYTDRSQRGFAARALPAGCVIAGNAPAILIESQLSLLFLLGWVNSRLMRSLVEMQAIDKKFYPGFVKALPWSPPSQSLVSVVEDSVSELLFVHGKYGVREETAPLFLQPWRVEKAEGLSEAVERFSQRWGEDCVRTRILQDDLSNRFDELYAIIDARTFAEAILDRDVTSETTFEAPDATEFVASICSYLAGLIFGRWDVRYATGERPAPDLPDPFAPLPACQPGMLQGDDGLPLSPEAGRRLRAEGLYPLDVAWDGILVDDPDHPADLVRRVQEALRAIWNDRSDTIEHEACAILKVKSLRSWFRKPTSFFDDHLARYTKSKRQAPIYWPLSSPSGLYTIWLYYHRLTADTLFTVLRDYLKPKLEFEERRAFQLRQEAGTTPSPSQRRDLAEAEELVEDLRAFKAELERVAPLFRPNLNDGVIINYAPLWRMIGLPKWRKDCQAIWNELAQGDYDWAHLAMHLWPERVGPNCATDRSLAIAHGLEEVFWQEDPKKPGKWIARKVAETEVSGLIAERSSAAVKAAVEEFSVRGQQQDSEASSAGRRKAVGGRRGKRASGQEDLL